MTASRILKVGEEFPAMTPAPPTSRPRLGAPKGPRTAANAKTGERFGTINAFLDATMASLRPCERAVWLLLWRDTKPSGIARASQADIARRAGASEYAVYLALRALVRRGLLIVVHRGGLNAGPSSYRVVALSRDD